MAFGPEISATFAFVDFDERNRIFAEAYGKDPDFFAFYRSMQAYENGLKGGDTRMVLNPKSDFFRFFGTPNGQPATPAAAAPSAPRQWIALTKLYGVNDWLLSRFEATEAKVSKKLYVVELSADERTMPQIAEALGTYPIMYARCSKAMGAGRDGRGVETQATRDAGRVCAATVANW